MLYVGVAQDGGNAASPVGLLKLARNGVMESGEFAYGRRYLAEPASFRCAPRLFFCRLDGSATVAHCR